MLIYVRCLTGQRRYTFIENLSSFWLVWHQTSSLERAQNFEKNHNRRELTQKENKLLEWIQLFRYKSKFHCHNWCVLPPRRTFRMRAKIDGPRGKNEDQTKNKKPNYINQRFSEPIDGCVPSVSQIIGRAYNTCFISRWRKKKKHTYRKFDTTLEKNLFSSLRVFFALLTAARNGASDSWTLPQSIFESERSRALNSLYNKNYCIIISNTDGKKQSTHATGQSVPD